MEENAGGDHEASSDDNDSEDDAAAGALHDNLGEASDDEDAQPFDISLAASHSYLGPGLAPVGGRQVLEAGWRGRLPLVAHNGVVFPGETVPLLLPRAGASAVTAAAAAAIQERRIFGLLCPDESGVVATGYGVVCEVFEAGAVEGLGAGLGAPAGVAGASVKARAIHRFRIADMPRRRPMLMHHYTNCGEVEVVVLPELAETAPLRGARLASLDAHRRPRLPPALRRLEAAASAWPAFVYDAFDYQRMRNAALKHAAARLEGGRLPEEPVPLSFWVASNLPLTPRDRLTLLRTDAALPRLHLALQLLDVKSVLCCSTCFAEISRRENIFAMSSEGFHSNYTNLGGFMHDVVTVTAATNTQLDGAASTECSWFPGYSWTIAICSICNTHVGWRFDATTRTLRPQRFFGLCRNTVQPSRNPMPFPNPLAGPAPSL